MAMKHETSIGILEDEIREMKVYIYMILLSLSLLLLE